MTGTVMCNCPISVGGQQGGNCFVPDIVNIGLSLKKKNDASDVPCNYFFLQLKCY